MKKSFAGKLSLGVFGKKRCYFENCVGGKVSLVQPDGTIVEFDIFEVLHSNLVEIDE